MTIDDLDKLLQEMKFESFHFYFATNTTGFQFFGSQKQINYRLIINPQWRIFKNDALINSSLSCPWHEDYENELKRYIMETRKVIIETIVKKVK